MSATSSTGPQLLLGPQLRHVDTSSATVWAEVSAPCRMEVLGAAADSFTVAGHHYALVVVEGLAPGSSTPYQVHLDGDLRWPPPNAEFPPSVIRPLAPDRPVRISFGSCRVATGKPSELDGTYGTDALEALAVRLAGQDPQEWPELLLMLGDQVYADLTSPGTRQRISQARGAGQAGGQAGDQAGDQAGAQQGGPPGEQVADFEEYTWLYQESWSLPRIRWLMSAVPVAMIFDDHDIHDDWNTSRAWREQQARTTWWEARITGGLMAYWVYQHLGNLSPAALAADEVYAQVRAHAARGEDAGRWMRAFAAAADQEADGSKGYRWSYRRELGRSRLVVLDSRCGRILDGERSMLSQAEFAWVQEALDPAAEHLLIGTSLPWLLAPALHAIESWNEVRCERAAAGAAPGWAERLRQAVDLEHWAAFGASFAQLSRALVDAGSPQPQRPAPATICVLSGDVHHSYVTQAFPQRASAAVSSGDGLRSRLFQVTCSPVHNAVPRPMLAAFRLAWHPWAAALAQRLARAAGAPEPGLRWGLSGPVLSGNAVARIELSGRTAHVVFESAGLRHGVPALTERVRHRLS